MPKKKKIIIVMPAYKTASLISEVCDRIPQKIWHKIEYLIIVNDGSPDELTAVIKQLQNRYPKILTIYKKENKGYARAQKSGFQLALLLGADIIVLLHSDGQYPPEQISRLIKPIEDNIADIVQGSRILGGGALEGGMPLYKYIANRCLTMLENIAFNTSFAELHSGYMLYSRKSLETIPFRKLSNTFHFDGEMLFIGKKKGLRLLELPIPTRYAGETSNLKPIPYGFSVLKIIFHYKIGKYNHLIYSKK